MNVVEFKNVKKARGEFKLDIPELAIKQGYITGFIGQNGAGKTTTIKLIMDLLKVDAGSIEIFGKDIKKHTAKLKDQIGFVGDPTGYTAESTIKDIKAMFSPFYSTWDEALFHKYIKRFDLDTNKKVKELSQGQNKQLALTMALARRPKLIILDEPTANLDPIVRNYILSVLMEHMQDEEVSVFYSTHITSDLDKASDYIVYIQDGKILFNEERELLSQKYYKVKGPNRILENNMKGQLIGCTQSSFGFEALTDNKQKAYGLFGSEAIYEKASIEEIMIFLEEGKRNG
ncbi:MAG: ABC transporter ATP-binding protein [Cellulosilyticaceae bacterium]